MTEKSLQLSSALLADGWRENVLLDLDEHGTIVAVREGGSATGATMIPGAVLPGMPNLHSHGFQRLIAGLTYAPGVARDSFWSWREAMYRFGGRITPEQFQVFLSWVFIEMLKAGYTSCAEFHYLHHPPGGTPYAEPAEMSARVLAAAETAGMPLTLLPVLYERSGFGAKDVNEPQLRFRHSVDAYMELLEACRSLAAGHPLHFTGMAPHSLRAVSRQSLDVLLEARRGTGQPFHIHIAEQPAEVSDCLQYHGARPVEWLLDQFDVDASWCLVHATHMEPGERAAAAATGAIAGLCPTTEADLGDGFFEVSEWLSGGGGFGIGSDSNLRVSVTEELRLLEFTERLRRGERNVLAEPSRSNGRMLYEDAARNGGRALGQPVGQLAPGFRADFVVLDTTAPGLTGRRQDTIIDSWVFAGGEAMIDSVWVAGKRVVERGRHPAEAHCQAAFVDVLGELLT